MFRKAVVRLSDFFHRFEARWRIFYMVLAASALVLQFSALASLHFQRAESRAVLRFQDPGSELAVSQVLQWNLVKPIQGFYQSPFYSRVAFLFSFFSPKYFDSSSQGLSADWMEKERSIHIILQLLNLLILYSIAFLLSSRFLKHLEDRLFSTLIFTSLLLLNPFVSQLVYTTQPFLFAGFLIFLTFHFLSTRLRLVSLLFGLALAAHLGSFWFLPAFLWLIFHSQIPWKWDVKEFVVACFGIFFLVSFPSYFNFPVLYHFLRDHLIELAIFDWQISLQNILLILTLLLLLSLGRVFSVVCFLVEPPKPLAWKQRRALLIFLGMVLAPALFLGFRLAPFWIVFPAAIVSFLVLDPHLIQFLQRTPVLQRVRTLDHKPWRFLIAFFVAPFLFNFYPQTHFETYLSQSSCRLEARRIEDLVESNTLRGKRLLVDPDVPYEKDLFGSSHVETTENIDVERFGRINPDMIVFSTRPHDLVRFQKLRLKNDFQNLFVGKAEFLDPLGYQWLKNEEESLNNCGFVVWDKQ